MHNNTALAKNTTLYNSRSIAIGCFQIKSENKQIRTLDIFGICMISVFYLIILQMAKYSLKNCSTIHPSTYTVNCLFLSPK